MDTENPTTPEPDAPADAPTPEPPASDSLSDPGKKALDAERKARREAEAELKRYRDAEKAREQEGLSAAEKEKARADELQAELATFRANALRGETATAVGIPAALAPWLRGDDAESMTADAEALLAALDSGFIRRSAGNSPEDTGAGKKADSPKRSPLELAAEVMGGGLR